MDNDKIIFDDKSMTDLYREMYNRSENKKTQINTILSDIQKHITDKNDAILMLPRINDFMIVGVKNDDNFLKMIAVIQKMETLKEGAVNGELLSEEEKEQLRNSIESSVTDLKSSINVPVENFKM
jgi:uncharacterized protein YeeX (DUF496 family)